MATIDSLKAQLLAASWAVYGNAPSNGIEPIIGADGVPMAMSAGSMVAAAYQTADGSIMIALRAHSLR
ncbi:hypothetical protein [Brytella acorum]|uniref:Uncharacterized protein n=1 Tax=Brytella acorum TaxID=2959299 RepID=A0AA35UIK5_9PROT|nr:hypothetical protein [Brytella acorum]MDF3626061.1 hypothetical protein [Brytella acorum]CAI9122162.1 hypothetical protein LMG32879_003022 [Brytella acorum]